MELTEGVGESSSPPRGAAPGGGAGGGGGFYDFRADIFSRLLASGHEVVANPEWREQLHAHLSRLPPSYGVDVYIERVEDVLVHQQLLADAKDPEKRPAFHVRFVENIWTKADGNGYMEQPAYCGSTHSTDSAHVRTSVSRNGDHEIDFEPCSKLEDLNLEVRKFVDDYAEKRDTLGSFSGRKETVCTPVHEITFSTVDKPKLLSQLSALLSDIGLNIREAHVFSTADGYSLDVFVVDGWHVEETGSLHEAVRQAIGENEGSWAGSSPSHSASEKTLSAPLRRDDWEIDRRVLKLGPKIANGSCGELYHGTYQGLDVAVKILRTDQVNEAMEEFAQEITILREVQHKNIVRFIGASTKRPELCIVTEYMPGGSLYDLLHKNHNILGLPLILRFALDICKGMEYLHKNNIIHRDLKTANLLMDTDNVVKVADFGVARFLHPGGIMTAETGTYRWMAPEVINHEPYDQKADVFSFAIVLWELLTGKVPYNSKTPLQAALGVRQGQRPDLPKNAHPKLLELMQRCWDENPSKRPTFTEITAELEGLQQSVEGGVEPFADGV